MTDTLLTFKDLGLSEQMLKALEKKGYGYPTTIQAEAIPHFMQWKDVIAKAPTGTGKTFAFGIPMIEHIDPENEAVQGLILAPTRELAIQIGDELRSLLAYYNGIRVAVLYGGAGIGGQIEVICGTGNIKVTVGIETFHKTATLILQITFHGKVKIKIIVIIVGFVLQ